MNVNPTVALTLILLALMGGAGVISAGWGYALGREALKGITQPDVRPTTAGSEAAQSQPRHQEMIIVPEAKILEEVKGRIDGNGATAQPGNVQSSTVQSMPLGAIVPPAGHPNALQPTTLPVTDPMGGLPPSDLPPATLEPSEQLPEGAPFDPIQPGSVPPDALSPSGFNPPAAVNDRVGFQLQRIGSDPVSMVRSKGDRLRAWRESVDVANSGYGAECVTIISPSNLCG